MSETSEEHVTVIKTGNDEYLKKILYMKTEGNILKVHKSYWLWLNHLAALENFTLKSLELNVLEEALRFGHVLDVRVKGGGGVKNDLQVLQLGHRNGDHVVNKWQNEEYLIGEWFSFSPR